MEKEGSKKVLLEVFPVFARGYAFIFFEKSGKMAFITELKFIGNLT